MVHSVLSGRCSHTNAATDSTSVVVSVDEGAAAVAAVDGRAAAARRPPSPSPSPSSSEQSRRLIFCNERNTLFRIEPDTLARRLHFAYFAQLMSEYPQLQLADVDRELHESDCASLATVCMFVYEQPNKR